MADSSARGKKRARLEEQAEGEDADVKLCSGLQARMAGQKYVKESALSREVLLSYLREKGDVARVRLVNVTVQEMGGRTFPVTLDDSAWWGDDAWPRNERGHLFHA